MKGKKGFASNTENGIFFIERRQTARRYRHSENRCLAVSANPDLPFRAGPDLPPQEVCVNEPRTCGPPRLGLNASCPVAPGEVARRLSCNFEIRRFQNSVTCLADPPSRRLTASFTSCGRISSPPPRGHGIFSGSFMCSGLDEVPRIEVLVVPWW